MRADSELLGKYQQSFLVLLLLGITLGLMQTKDGFLLWSCTPCPKQHSLHWLLFSSLSIAVGALPMLRVGRV